MDAILTFLKQPLWLDTATGWWLLLALGVVVEYALGRSKSVKANSGAALVGHGLRLLLVRVGLLRLPVVGPLIVRGLEVFSGVDLDGDGHVGDPKQPAPPRAPPAAVFLLGLLALGAASCKTTGTPGPVPPVVYDTALDCAKTATHNTAISLLDDVGSALLEGDWVGALTKLVTRWGGEAIDCAVSEVFGQAQTNAMASKDPLEATKAERAGAWLEARGLKPPPGAARASSATPTR